MRPGRLALCELAVMLLVLAVLPFAASTANVPKPDPPRRVWVSSAYQPPERCPGAQKAIGHYRRAFNAARSSMGLAGAPPRAWYPCDAARRRAVEWRDKAWQAKRAYAKWRNERTLPNTDNWTRAVRTTQRVFPGTDEWLFAISNRECRACYTVSGGFVCNYGGSGACGPMQFMSGTFYGYADNARAAVQDRGFIVDPSVWNWRNPLGQALVAGYMRYTGRDGCHWCL